MFKARASKSQSGTRLRKRTLGFVFCLFAVFVPIVAGFPGAFPVGSSKTVRGAVRERFEEDPQGRAEWFEFQRAYPYRHVPDGARVRAFRKAALADPDQWKALPGDAWRPLGPSPATGMPEEWGLVSGRIGGIAVSPVDSQTIFIASAAGGVWRTTDRGRSWKPLTDDQPTLTAGAIAIASSNPRILYVGTGDANHNNRYFGAGVLKSTDGGDSWTQLRFGTPGTAALEYSTVSKIVIDPANPDAVLIGVASLRDSSTSSLNPTGVWSTSDGGRTWRQTLKLAPTGAIYDLLRNPLNPRIVFAAASLLFAPDNGVYKSVDGGETWRRLGGGLPEGSFIRRIALALTPSRPETMFASILGNSGYLGVFKSTDAGDTWNVLPESLAYCKSQCWYDHYLAVGPVNPDELYLGEIDLVKSTDGGNNWTNLTRTLSAIHPDQHCFAFDPRDPSMMYLGGDGGLYATRDGGRTFLNLNGNLSLTMHTSLALHPTNPNVMLAGTQDNGTLLTDGSTVWKQVAFGDGGRTVIDARDPETAYSTTYYTNILKSLTGGRSFFDLTTGETFFGERSAFYAPLVADPNDSKTLFFGTNRIWRTTNGGLDWNPTANGDLTQSPLGVVTTITVQKGNSDLILYGTSDGAAGFSTDGGKTFSRSQGVPNRFVTRIMLDPRDSKVAYATVSGFGTDHVYKTTDGGVHFFGVGDSLPNVPANVVLVDPTDSETVYVGTDLGIYRSRNGGRSWVPFNRGLPNVIVTDLVANPVTGALRAATYGRGIYELIVGTPPPNPDLAVGDVQIEPGKVVRGGEATVSVSVRNKGIGKAEASRLEARLSIDPTIDSSDTVVFSVELSSIESGNDVPLRFSTRIPADVPNGLRYLGIVADSTGQLNDPNRDDNRKTAVFEVVEPDDKQPPEVSGVVVPAKIKRGSKIAVVWSSRDAVGVVAHDVALALNGLPPFDLPVATGLPGGVQRFEWEVPQSVPKSKAARIRVTARDAAGNVGFGDSGPTRIK